MISEVFQRIYTMFDSALNPWDYLGNRHVNDIKNNRNDMAIIDKAFNELKKDRSIADKKVTLSCGMDVYISI